MKIKDIAREAGRNALQEMKRPQWWGFFVSLAVMALLAMAFFYPDASLGNQLRQYDMQQGAAIGYEATAYAEAHGGDLPRWTNSLFSGMPNFQISPVYGSDSLFSWINTIYGAGLPSPSNLLFMMMAGFLILMAALKVRWYYGLIGAVAWGFSTYFIIIIGAGHIWKFVTLAYIPPTIAGIIMAYRGRWLLGSALAALFAMMQIKSNHIQMSYYFIFVVAVLVIAYLLQAFRNHEIRRWLKATGTLAVAAVLAVAANLPNLYHTYRYASESMRGGHSELTSTADASQKTSGLDRDYITQYSYGRSETFTLLIPNVKGGASVEPYNGSLRPTSLLDAPDADKIVNASGAGEIERQYVANYVGQYFGEPESTNGPVYVGAIIFTLFLLGCCVVRGPLKWTLLAMTILSVGLALGRNLQWLTDLFIDYMPMYSKFRTPESILVVAEFCIPLLGILGLQKVLTAPDGLRTYRKELIGCFGVTALLCVLGWLFPSVYGPAISQGDMQLSEMLGYQLIQAGYPQQAVSVFSIHNPTVAALVEQLRYSLVSADSLRSLIYILLAFGAIKLCSIKSVKPWMAATLVGVLIGVDLYTVNKRYLNHESFCSPQVSASDPFPLSAADRQILADTAMNYRVLDIPNFYKAAPSRHHKAVGGYHAAKLTRYQDLIDRHLGNIAAGNATDADMRVASMLNTKYIVTDPSTVIPNPDAMGNAWFIDRVDFVDTPDQEMAALSTIDPRHVAVADKRFIKTLKGAPKAEGDTIYETTYAPDRLTYKAKSARGGVAVFSEVYFPWGWEATVDGKPVEIARVNYLLRSIDIPAGEHSVEFTFRPASVGATVGVAKASVWTIYLLLIVAVIVSLIRKPSDTADENKAEE